MNDSNTVSILIAMAVFSAVWGIAQVLATQFSSDRRKIKTRLSGEQSVSTENVTRRSIVQQQIEARGISGWLASKPVFNDLYRALLQTWPEMPMTRFLGIMAGCGGMAFIVFGGMFNSIVMGFVASLLAMYTPFLVLAAKRNRRQRLLANELPDALDFLSRILRAGHSLSTGLQMMGDELPEPLAAEFRRCHAQHSLGQPLEDALTDMANKIESTDFAFFVTAVLIQRQTGGDLSEVLSNISGMIRQRIRLQQHVKAKTAEGRFTGYILVAFPALVFMIMQYVNADYSGQLVHTSAGIKMLGLSLVLQVLGLLSIRKLMTVKV
jgi:tight adherence protein B